jgi:hypothetical protein
MLLVVGLRPAVLGPLGGQLQQRFPNTGNTEEQLASLLAYGVEMEARTKDSLTFVLVDLPYGRTDGCGKVRDRNPGGTRICSHGSGSTRPPSHAAIQDGKPALLQTLYGSNRSCQAVTDS